MHWIVLICCIYCIVIDASMPISSIPYHSSLIHSTRVTTNIRNANKNNPLQSKRINQNYKRPTLNHHSHDKDVSQFLKDVHNGLSLSNIKRKFDSKSTQMEWSIRANELAKTAAKYGRLDVLEYLSLQPGVDLMKDLKAIQHRFYHDRYLSDPDYFFMILILYDHSEPIRKYLADDRYNHMYTEQYFCLLFVPCATTFVVSDYVNNHLDKWTSLAIQRGSIHVLKEFAHLAALEKNINVLQLLYTQGRHLSMHWKDIPLYSVDHDSVLNFLLSQGDLVDWFYNDYETLKHAIVKGKSSVLQFYATHLMQQLIEKDILHFVIKHESLRNQIMDIYAKDGIKWTTLAIAKGATQSLEYISYWAASHAQMDILQLLSNVQGSRVLEYKDLLYHAVANNGKMEGKLQVLDFLLSSYSFQHLSQETLNHTFRRAIHHLESPIVKFFLNLRDSHGNPLLHIKHSSWVQNILQWDTEWQKEYKRTSELLDLFQFYPGFRSQLIHFLNNKDVKYGKHIPNVRPTQTSKWNYIFKYAILHNDLELLTILYTKDSKYKYMHNTLALLNSIRESIKGADQDIVSLVQTLYSIDLKDPETRSSTIHGDRTDILKLMRIADPNVDLTIQNTNTLALEAIQNKYYSVLEYLCQWALETSHMETLEYIYKESKMRDLQLEKIFTPHIRKLANQLKEKGKYIGYDFIYFLSLPDSLFS